MTSTPPMKKIRISAPCHRGLLRTFLGTGGVYRPLSSAEVYLPTVEVLGPGRLPLAVVRPAAERPFFCARPGPVFAGGVTGDEDSHHNRGAQSATSDRSEVPDQHDLVGPRFPSGRNSRRVTSAGTTRSGCGGVG